MKKNEYSLAIQNKRWLRITVAVLFAPIVYGALVLQALVEGGSAVIDSLAHHTRIINKIYKAVFAENTAVVKTPFTEE